MAELLLHVAFIDLGRRGQARAQRMPCEYLRALAFGKITADAGGERRGFHQPRDVAIVQPIDADTPAAINHAAEDRTMCDARKFQPGLKRYDRTGEIGRAAADFEKLFPSVSAKTNSQLRLVWIACGLDDTLLSVNRQFKDWMKSKDVQFTDVEVPGYAHVWPLWRQNLTELAPLLFQVRNK